MKKYSMILAVLMLLSLSIKAEHVTPETAHKVATTFLNNNGAKTAQLTDLSKAAGFPNLYIFSTENSFVVMAADDCVKPILGYSLTGSFDADNIPNNVHSWLKGYSDEIQYAVESKMRASTETSQLWKALINGKNNAAKTTALVAPLIQTKWNQNKYYNNLCPTASGGPDGHAYTGCVATAMAQIMKYHNYPSSGIGSHSYTWNDQTLNANFGATAYDWNNMANTYNYYYNDNGNKIVLEENARTPEQIAAVATLMYHCGVAVDMEYGGGGSGAYTYLVANALKTYFNYSSDIEYREKEDYDGEEWIAMLKAELNQRRPLEYCGSGSSGGHAFVCDGYNDSDYFHFNWGWSGHYDGYFSLSNLDTGANNESGSGNGVYTNGQAAIFGIKPSSNNAVPTDLTYSLSGLQDVTLNWTYSNGAISYNIYRNGTLISNTTGNTYTETAPFGTNVYYVRSVNSAGDLSLPSNLITITINYQQPIVDDLKATFSGNHASLTWTTPEWCYPETASATLTYGDGVYSNCIGTNGSYCVYWGHRFTTSTLANYDEMVIYKISFYASTAGTYRCFIYNGSIIEGDKIHPQTQVADTIITTSRAGWFDINLSESLNIDESQDLWVFMFDPEYKSFPITFCNFTDNTEGSYYISSDPLSNTNPLNSFLKTQNGVAWLIRTYLTDGTYTYNLYDNGIKLNGETPISDTSYTIESIENNTIHNYTVKTNYYDGESAASNTASLALGSNTLASLTLENNDNMTIGSGSTLTVTGILSNADAANLVLEDGAQLIHNSDGVAATVKKDIAAWTTEPFIGGWYFIASPINSTELAPDSVTNMLTDANEENAARTYDLYRLENDNWKNYRKNAFNLTNGEGYLYANENTQTLSFKGEIKPYDIENNTVTVSAGWNLIGNPYTCNVVPSLAYHILNNGASTTSVNANTGLVTPGMGIAVYSENGGTLSFNLPTESASALSNGNLQITLNQQITNRNNVNTIAIDNTIVSFNESEGLPKFPLLEANSKLYIPKGNEEYAIVSSATQGDMPINFHVAEDGTYTLTVNPEDVEMNYLHLIDNLTGNDIDLLASPNYTFEAKTTDYVSRFRLVFASVREDTDDNNENFAFINDGNIIVYKEGTLQIFDITGRIVLSGDAMNRVSTSGMTPGVYVLRLITANGVKTQKIIID